MRKQLIFVDIDGTLTLPGEFTPPESALEAIRRARAAGHGVFLCTGRNRSMLSPLLRYGFDGYVGCAGGLVALGNELIFDCPMTSEQLRTAMSLLSGEGVFLTLEGRDAMYGDEGIADFFASSRCGYNSELARWRRTLESNYNIRPMSEYDGEPVYKLVFLCETEAQLAPARAALSGAFHFVVQEAFTTSCLNGELINLAFDKGRGMLRIAQKLGVGAEDTIGIGDSLNDLELLETAGTSVCMANGSEALKERADLVCPAVEEDGLAWAFSRLGLC